MKEKPSLLIIGNSNVGKSSITKLLLNLAKFKGKTGKSPGSTLIIRAISQPKLPYQIVDLPGFGYMKHSSRRREEHIKKQIVIHIEKYHKDYFFGLVVINILRIDDEITKYHIKNRDTIPLSIELIQFLLEYEIPILTVINKIDKVSSIHKKRIIKLFIDAAKDYGLNFKNLETTTNVREDLNYLELSALKKTNIGKLKKVLQTQLILSKRDSS